METRAFYLLQVHFINPLTSDETLKLFNEQIFLMDIISLKAIDYFQFLPETENKKKS